MMMKPNDLLRITERGLYCEAGGFYIDPWLPVDRAVITHAHGDHARWGSKTYACSAEAERVLSTRVGSEPSSGVHGRERFLVNGVTLSFHPAGHILGSAQIRVEHQGETWVVSGDYKTEPDPTCTPFEPVRCNVFITESTFGLPDLSLAVCRRRPSPRWRVVEGQSRSRTRHPSSSPTHSAKRNGSWQAWPTCRRRVLHARRGRATESRLPRRAASRCLPTTYASSVAREP